MFRKPYLRAAIFVIGLGFFVQITGINAIVYYSPRIFEAMGFTGNAATLGLPALVQVAGLLAVFVSVVLVDRLGRRPILLIGIGIMIAANIVLVVTFSLGSDFGGALTLLGFVGLLLFTVGFTFGFGALVWVYAGESFPARLRSIGASAMLTANLVANAIVAAVFLRLLETLGGAGTFAVFGMLAVAAFVFNYRMAPETKGRPLEDIRQYWENDGVWPEASTAGPAVGERDRPVSARSWASTSGGRRRTRCWPTAPACSPRRWPAAPTSPRWGPARRPGSCRPRWNSWAAPTIGGVCAGAAGADSPEQRAQLAALITGLLPAARVDVVHDAQLLLAAAGLDTGIALISGTGSVAWGIDPDGRSRRAGGWGYLLGDEGSGYGVTRTAVRHVLARQDRDEAPDRLTAALIAGCGLAGAERLQERFYANPERRYWARQAGVVFELAAAGDPASRMIVDEAAQSLRCLVGTVAGVLRRHRAAGLRRRPDHPSTRAAGPAAPRPGRRRHHRRPVARPRPGARRRAAGPRGHRRLNHTPTRQESIP